jgi:two-component system, NarL family, invasion response regulator UvrY
VSPADQPNGTRPSLPVPASSEQAGPIKVLIVDDHPIVVSGFKALIEQEPDIMVMAAASASEGADLFAAHAPQVAVVDINLPGRSGFALTQDLLATNVKAHIILFSMNDDPVFVAQAKAIGARGFVSKNDDPATLLAAIRAVAGGGEYWQPDKALPADVALSRFSSGGKQASSITLSPRDSQVLRLLATGKSLSEIADTVGVSYKTVASTCVALRAKLGARTQSELVRVAVERRLI